MTQYKDKSKKVTNIPVGLFTYPVLMASDILLYDADYIPVGIDQKQHVELCRDLALRFNHKYGDTFKIPTPMIPEMGAKIMDLQDPTKKMSKSSANEKGNIFLLDDEKAIRKKIMSAVTDSDAGISNLLTIYACMKDISIDDAVSHFKDYNYGNLKKEVADAVIEKIIPIQEKYNELINSEYLDKILDEGRDKTIAIAKKKYEEVLAKVGLGR